MGNTGGLFIGALKAEDKSFLKPLLKNAREQGYNRFVEPCAGAMAMSYLAIEAGYKPEQIEASDISFFSGVFGRAISDKSLEDMNIIADGFTTEELKNPATALYAQLYLRMKKQASNQYFFELLKDLVVRKKEHINIIQSQIDNMQSKCKGINYRDLCMWKHIREVKDDENAVVVLCPPTYTAGYEKFFDTGGKLSWDEPTFEVFDTETGLRDLYDVIADAKALFIVYEERKSGDSVGAAIYGRNAGRSGICMYLTSNRPDEATDLAQGKVIARKGGSKMSPLKREIIPSNYEVTSKSEVKVIPIKAENATYYRKLWTHNFNGGSSGNSMAMIIDGFVAGVFGYDKMTMALGGKKDLFFKFGISAPSLQRLNRLMYMLASSRKIINGVLDDIQKEHIEGVSTVMLTKYPESKEMRGIMKLTERLKDKLCGYKLKYRCDISDKIEKEILTEWVQKEKKWQENRKKSMK